MSCSDILHRFILDHFGCTISQIQQLDLQFMAIERESIQSPLNITSGCAAASAKLRVRTYSHQRTTMIQEVQTKVTHKV